MHTVGLLDRDFKRLSEFIHAEYGIKMPASKKTMLEMRLQKRLRNLGLESFKEYCKYLFSPKGLEAELNQMIDVVTTHKTDFIREPMHFEYLIQSILPEWTQTYGAGSRKKFNAWSAGCSTGEEPYSLAMILSEYAQAFPGFNYSILATDISAKVVEVAKRGIYHQDKVNVVPVALKQKYLLKSKDKKKELVRIIPELRTRVMFKQLNFTDTHYAPREPMDIIFCRNVIIYFDRLTQEQVMKRLCRHLCSGGYLFAGHSETLHGMDLPLTLAAPTIYKRTA